MTRTTTTIPTAQLTAELTQRIETTRELYFRNAEHQRNATSAIERSNHQERCTELAAIERQLLSLLDWARTFE